MAPIAQNLETASIAPSQAETLTPERDAMQRFTAIGRPMQAYNPSALLNIDYDSPAAQAPQFLPVRFTDESILDIPVPVGDIPTPTGTIDDTKPVIESTGNNSGRKRSFVERLRGKSTSEEGRKKKQGAFQMVKMTRREYLMYWAKDEDGKYAGSEPLEKRGEFWRSRGM